MPSALNLLIFVDSTPGVPNDVGSTLAILAATHVPNVPNEGEPLQVTGTRVDDHR